MSGNNQHSLNELSGHDDQAARVAEVVDRWERAGRITEHQAGALKAASTLLTLLPASDRQRMIDDLLRRNGDFTNNVALNDRTGSIGSDDTDPFSGNVALHPREQ